MTTTKDHLDILEEAIFLVRSLRSLMQPRDQGGCGLTAAAVAQALGMHPKGTGVTAWTGRWNPRSKRWEGGRNLPAEIGPQKKVALRRFVHRNMERWAKEFESGVSAPPKRPGPWPKNGKSGMAVTVHEHLLRQEAAGK